MRNISPQTRGIEVEMGIVDNEGYACFPSKHGEENAYDTLIHYRKPDPILVKPEVINNMVELVTDPHKSIESAQKQASSLMALCIQKSKDIGMSLSQVPWTKINREKLPHDQLVEYCVTPKDYYQIATQEILSVLQDPYDLLGAGCMATHIHISAEDDEATLLLFKAMSNYATHIWKHGAHPQNMYMSPERYYQWNKIIQARKKLGHLVGGIDPEIIPEDYLPYIYEHYFDQKGNIKRMHNIIALKKPGERLTVEVRSPDGAINHQTLAEIIYFTQYLVQKSLSTLSTRTSLSTL